MVTHSVDTAIAKSKYATTNNTTMLSLHREKIPAQTLPSLWLARAQCCLTKPMHKQTRQQANAGIYSH